MDSLCSCWQCERQFAGDRVIPYRGGWVCGSCKPIFFQKLQEGLTPRLRKHLEIAGFLPRAIAKIVDLLITTTFNWVITLLTFSLMGSMLFENTADFIDMLMIFFSYASGLVIPCVYETYMVGRYKATLGKMLLGLKVIRPDGEKISYLRSFGRYWGTSLSGLICLIGYLMAAFDDEARTLHDHLADTRVVHGN